MAELLNALGKKVKAKRKELGLSQEEFAHKCGFDRTYISMIERGKRNISFSNLATVALGLGVSVSQLTDGIEHDTDTG